MASPTRPDACDGAPPLPAGQRIRIDADDARALDVLYIRREQCPHHVLFAPEAMLEVTLARPVRRPRQVPRKA